MGDATGTITDAGRAEDIPLTIGLLMAPTEIEITLPSGFSSVSSLGACLTNMNTLLRARPRLLGRAPRTSRREPAAAPPCAARQRRDLFRQRWKAHADRPWPA